MITRKNIISKTHYGLKIVSYILRQFDQDILLQLERRQFKNKYKLLVNPFLKGTEPSLSIIIENHIAVYKDIDTPSFSGDVFDFAQLYFKEDSEQQLLVVIDKALNLKLAPKISEYEENRQKINERLDQIPDHRIDPTFSYFSRNLFNLYPTVKITIPETHTMIINPIRKYKTEKLRKLRSDQQKMYKKQHFDYVTFSGVFTKRNNSSIIRHSNLLTIDIDGIHESYRLQEIKETLLDDPYFPTELLFISPRGSGLKWIVEISLKEVSHSDYFKAISRYLKQTYAIEMDTNGADLCRACLLPYDPNAYIHPKYI